MKNYQEMNEIQLDLLKELGSIGGGNAATALSSILGTKVNMALPKVEMLGFNEALALLGDPEEVIAAILVQMSGGVEGIMLFLLSKDFSDEILYRMLNRPPVDLFDLDEIDISGLTEIGNIVISSYVTAMSSLSGVEMELSVPQFTVNMLGGIMSMPMAMMGQYSDQIMMITGEFQIDGKALHSDMLLLPDVRSLEVLMKKLGVN